MTQFAKIGFSLFCLLLTNCSLVGYAYDRGPSFVTSELDDVFDLTEAQNQQLEQPLKQLFLWHRQHELLRYQQFLDRAAIATADGFETEELLELTDEIQLTWRRTITQIVESLVDLAPTLDKTQIENFERYYRESSERHNDSRELSAQQREIKRNSRDLKRLQKWFGKFDYYLEKRVLARLLQIPDITEAWHRYREARYRALTAALNAAATDGLTSQQLLDILFSDSTAYALEFTPVREAYRQSYAAALADISKWLSPSQRQRAIARLRRFAGIVENLRN